MRSELEKAREIAEQVASIDGGAIDYFALTGEIANVETFLEEVRLSPCPSTAYKTYLVKYAMDRRKSLDTQPHG